MTTGYNSESRQGEGRGFVPMRDEIIMAEKINEMLRDPLYKEKLITGMQKQIKKFDIENTIKKIEELLLSLEKVSSLQV